MSTISKENINLKNLVKETLKGLGIRPDILGYEYLKFIFIDSIEFGIPPHKDITINTYPLIGAHFQKNNSQVERSIRHSIENAQKEKTELFNKLFGTFSKVTNSLFLAVVYEYITEDLICDDAEV